MVNVQVRGESKIAEVRTSPTQSANGLVVLTTPLVCMRPCPAPMVHPDFGRAMNQLVAFGGTPIGIHDGTDSSLWTGSNIVGTQYTEDSTEQAFAGSMSSKIDNPEVNDVWEFNSGGTQVLSGCVALSLYIYVDKDWTTDSIEVYGWDGAADVGVRVGLEDYFDQSNFDVWQLVVVPFVDMELATATVESFRMTCASKSGPKAPVFFIDMFQIEETGATAVFSPLPKDPSKDTYISRISLSLADNVSSVVPDGTMPGLDYTAFLGVSALALGIRFEHLDNYESVISEVYTGIGQMCEFGWKPTCLMSDGTNSFVTMVREFEVPILVRGPVRGNRVSLIVRDDLSGLLSMSAHVLAAQPR